MIDARSEVKAKGDRGTLVVSVWLAEQNGWIANPPKGSSLTSQTPTNVVDLYKRLKAKIADHPDAVRDLDALCRAMKKGAA